VLERLRAGGGQVRLDGLDAEELAAWRRASKVVQLRMLRVGHERLRRYGSAGRPDLHIFRTDQQEDAAAPTPCVPAPPVVPQDGGVRRPLGAGPFAGQ
jgi:hypothetical protein